MPRYRGPNRVNKADLRDQLAAMTILCRALLDRQGGTITLLEGDIEGQQPMTVKYIGTNAIRLCLAKKEGSIN